MHGTKSELLRYKSTPIAALQGPVLSGDFMSLPLLHHSTPRAPSRPLAWLLRQRDAVLSRWERLDLAQQFMLITSVALIVGMQFVGQWVAQRIGEGIIKTHGATSALYAESFIRSRVQELATRDTLSAESREALDALLLPQAVGQAIAGFRIWKGDTVVYADKPELIGQVFPPSRLLEQAWLGKLAVEYEEHEPGHGPDVTDDEALLEIYIPIRRLGGSNEVIALAETYIIAHELRKELRSARLGTWFAVASFTAGLLLLQFFIVRRGNRTIREQRAALNHRIEELSDLLSENRSLRARSQEASRRVAEMDERILRRIGSDLHDGPVQFLGMAVLRLDSLEDSLSEAPKTVVAEAGVDISALREGLRECLAEIRNLSSGLAPADIERLNLADTLALAAQRHERHTGTDVQRDIGALPDDVPLALKSCFFRLVQEGLTNAYRHAEAHAQAVTARANGDSIEVAVLDRGPGGTQPPVVDGESGFGLAGLRDRVESLGGEFAFTSRPGGGMRLAATLRFSSHAPRKNP